MGLLSFGHAVYFGFVDYVCGNAIKIWSLTLELVILGGAAVSAVMGLLFGGLAIRHSRIYFAMITLALPR